MLKRSMLFLLMVLSIVACKEHRMDQIKNFRILVDSNDPALQNSIRVLVQDYNSRIGYDALSVTDASEDSTSVIRFRKGLIEDGRKLGLGQWTTLKSLTSKGYIERTETTTIEYGMEIVFDEENFSRKSVSIADETSEGYKHLFHLFAHEVGHGMQMNHADAIDNVMYPNIPEEKSRDLNYDLYFENIRQFMGHASNETVVTGENCDGIHKHSHQE